MSFSTKLGLNFIDNKFIEPINSTRIYSPLNRFRGRAMNYLRLLTVSIFTFAISILGLGSVAYSQSLQEALGLAYINNPSLNAERAGVRAVKKTRAQAIARFLPSISATANYGDRSINLNPTEVKTEDVFLEVPSLGRIKTGENPVSRVDGDIEIKPATQIQLSADQILFDWRTVSGLMQVDSGIQRQYDSLAATEQDVLLSSATAYMDVIRDTAIVDSRKSNIEFLENEVRAANDRFGVGEITRTDILQAEARLALAKSQLNGAEANLSSSNAKFREVIGQDPKNLAPDTSIIKFIPRSQNNAIELAQINHPSVRQAEIGVMSAEASVGTATADLFPKLNANASITTTFDHKDNLGFQEENPRLSAGFGLQLSIPIVSGGREYAEISQEKEKLKQAKLNLAMARQQIRSFVIQAWGQYVAASASIPAAEAGLEAEELALEGIKAEQEVGQRTTREVLDQQRSLVEAQVNLIESQRNRIVAAFTLIAATGGLTSSKIDLELPAAIPDEYVTD